MSTPADQSRTNDQPTAAPSGRDPGNRNARRRPLLVAGVIGSLVVVAAAAVATYNVLEPDTSTSADTSTGGGDNAHNGIVAGTVWVANEEGGSLTAIDAGSNRVVSTVTGIEGPHNVQVSPDNKGVWAVSGHNAMAAMLDSQSLELHGTTPTGTAPAHVVISPDGKTTYTTNGADNTVTAINSATMKAVATIPVGDGPHGLRVSPDGAWVYVANVAGTTLSVIDTQTNTRVEDIEVGRAPAQVGFSADGRFVYASLSAEDAVAKIDVKTRTLLDTVSVGQGPIQVYASPDDRFLLVANQGTEDDPGTTVSVIDTDTFTVRADVETGSGAHGVAIDPSSTHAYITNIYGNDVAVLDLNQLEVVARIPVGDKPNGVSFSNVELQNPGDVRVTLPELTSGTRGDSEAHAH